MKCFYHHATDSVGVCRSCGRGLCPACLTEFPEGLACKDSCETAVQEAMLLVKRNRTAVAKGRPSNYLFPALFVVMGAIQLYQGLLESRQPINGLTALGALFTIVGVIYVALVRRFYRT